MFSGSSSKASLCLTNLIRCLCRAIKKEPPVREGRVTWLLWMK